MRLISADPHVLSSKPLARPECRFVDADTNTSGGHVLGRIEYGARSGAPFLDDGVPTLRLHKYDDAFDGFTEQWHVSGPTRNGHMRGLVYAHDDTWLFCAGFIPAGDEYAEASRRVYADAFALVLQLGFPRMVRMWNYIPHINGANREGLEVYRDFCRGRAIAFEEAYASTSSSGMPAATGIGTWGDGIGFYFLACREQAVTHIENTRQTPAYRYPSCYGPKPPSFARATLLGDASTPHADAAMFVSGTSSIVGSETVHAGDLRKQWEVTIGNVAHLIGADNLAAQDVRHAYTLADLDCIKVYYRHARDLDEVKRLAQAAFAPRASVRFINVDVCRDDLLVEIEGIASQRHRVTSA
jgi:chorismate lyase / 3-hydroxybenzoate synthase